MFPRAFENNSLCKIWAGGGGEGANKVYYGEFENRELASFKNTINTLCLSLQNFAKSLFSFSPGTYNGSKRNWKQCLCKLLEGQTKSIMVLLILANFSNLSKSCTLTRRHEMFSLGEH